MRGLQRDRGGLEEVARAQQNPSGPQRYWKTKIKTTTDPNFQATEAQANTRPYRQRRTEDRQTNQSAWMAGNLITRKLNLFAKIRNHFVSRFILKSAEKLINFATFTFINTSLKI